MKKVKICGNTTLEDAQKAVQFGADALGFVFFKKSPRFISPGEVNRIIKKIPPFVSCIGVFVDRNKKEVKEIANECRLDGLQFHGNESVEYCREFIKQYKIIKAIKIKDENSLKNIVPYENMDAILLDTYRKDLPGGTGKKFNWELVIKTKENYDIPLILAGGLTPDNIETAIEKVNPYAVDVANGVEKEPGKKDYKLMEAFIRKSKICNK